MSEALPQVIQPAEWETHSALWTAWPSHPEYWDGHIASARADVARFLKLLAEPVPGSRSPEVVKLWADGVEALQSAREAMEGRDVELLEEPLGDIWFRDIAPVFVRNKNGAIQYRSFQYNGWGGKYVMANDDTVALRIAASAGVPGQQVPMVFEGGALDVNGSGFGLTTRSCLLNPNRNPQMSQLQVEDILREHLGVDSLIWLDDGLLNDHTDGHIDNIARFVSKEVVVCQHPSGNDDPNREVLQRISADLQAWRSPSGEALTVVEIPSPGKVTDSDGRVMPASHMNFYIANHRVIMPTYGTGFESQALEALQALFPNREVVGSPACGLLTGGGAFHCITQQQPQAD
jgi:agmatine deiminase